ncbi:hypothetical protein HYX12_03855 [Candidatus Woesearchaeota archaeon]|nr:hypothetical protein [Candidatus Woesearchaeota archaeon]
MDTLSQSQRTAILRNIKLGKIIQEQYPEVLEMYKNSYSPIEIVRELELDSIYRVAVQSAARAVGYALAGSHFEVCYKGLVTNRRELGKLRRSHALRIKSKAGTTAFRQKRGIHQEGIDHSKNGKDGGSKGGKKAYESNKGIYDHHRTPEQKRRDSLEGAIARGYHPWSKQEEKWLYQSALDNRFRIRGVPSYQRLAEEMNHQRTSRAVRHKLEYLISLANNDDPLVERYQWLIEYRNRQIIP